MRSSTPGSSLTGRPTVSLPQELALVKEQVVEREDSFPGPVRREPALVPAGLGRQPKTLAREQTLTQEVSQHLSAKNIAYLQSRTGVKSVHVIDTSDQENASLRETASGRREPSPDRFSLEGCKLVSRNSFMTQAMRLYQDRDASLPWDVVEGSLSDLLTECQDKGFLIIAEQGDQGLSLPQISDLLRSEVSSQRSLACIALRGLLDRRELAVSSEAYTDTPLDDLTPLERSVLNISQTFSDTLVRHTGLAHTKARELTTRVLLLLVVSDLPPQLPSLLLSSLQLRQNPQSLMESLACLRSFLISSLEERSAEVLWMSILAVEAPPPPLCMPHARRTSSSYEKHIQYCLESYSSSQSEQSMAKGLDSMVILSRWSRCDAAIELADLPSVLCSIIMRTHGLPLGDSILILCLQILCGLIRNIIKSDSPYLSPTELNSLMTIVKKSSSVPGLSWWLRMLCELTRKMPKLIEWVSEHHDFESESLTKDPSVIIWNMRLLRIATFSSKDLRISSKLLDSVLSAYSSQPKIDIEALLLVEALAVQCKDEAEISSLGSKAIELLQTFPLNGSSIFDGRKILRLAAALHLLATIFFEEKELRICNDRLDRALSFHKRNVLSLLQEHRSVTEFIANARMVMNYTSSTTSSIPCWCKMEWEFALSRLERLSIHRNENSSAVAYGLFNWQVSLLNEFTILQKIRYQISEELDSDALIITILNTIPLLHLPFPVISLVSWVVEHLYDRASRSGCMMLLSSEQIIEKCVTSHTGVIHHRIAALSAALPDAANHIHFKEDWLLSIFSRLDGLSLSTWLQIILHTSHDEKLFPTICTDPGRALFNIIKLVDIDHVSKWPMQLEAFDLACECFIGLSSYFISRITPLTSPSFRYWITAEYYSTKRIHSGKWHCEEALDDLLGKLLEPTVSLAIREDVHASAFAIFLSPAATSSRCCERVWREFGEIRLLHLLDSPLLCLNDAIFMIYSNNRLLHEAITNGLLSLRRSGDFNSYIYRFGLSQLRCYGPREALSH